MADTGREMPVEGGGEMTRNKAQISYTGKRKSHVVSSYAEVRKLGEAEASAYVMWLTDPERQPVQCGKIVVSKAEVSKCKSG